MGSSDILQLRVRSISLEAEGIRSFDLRPVPPLRELPPFTAGAHIDLHLPNGLIRSYSLLNPPGETHRYLIAVNRDPNSRGGSRYLHEALQVGDVLTAGMPRNNFPLDEAASHSIFIAGGIGITPMWCMIQRLEQIGRPWTLHYAARTRRNAALLGAIGEVAGKGGRVELTFDAEPGGVMLDLAAIVEQAPPDAHLYCCGPVPMLECFERAAAGRSAGTVHVEYFAAKDKPDTAGGFIVELARSGTTIFVPAGKTILDALLDEGVGVDYSCQEGICGMCEVRVLEGDPEHRDLVLSAEEKARNDSMMICCSGARSSKLVLDI